MSTESDFRIQDDVFYEQQESELTKEFRRFDDSHLTRYLFVMGDDIPVNDRGGGRFWGLYKDEVIRKRQLFPVKFARTLAPFELPAITGTAEVISGTHLSNYEAQSLAAGMDGRQNSMRLMRPPKTVAYEIMGEYEDSAYGPALFEHAQLMGDDKRDLVRKLYHAIVPPAVKADPDKKALRHFAGEGVLKPITRKGVKFLGAVTHIWLDQWVDYFNNYAAQNIFTANLSRHCPANVEGTDSPLSQHDLAFFMLDRMREAGARALSNQKAYLDKSREEITSKRSGGRGKSWYDARDERYLLETGTIPLNLEEVAAATKMQSQSEQVVIAAVDRIVERMNPIGQIGDVAALIQEKVQEQVGAVFDNLSYEQLEKLLERKRAAQETLEVPADDPAARKAEARQQRREEEKAAASADAPQMGAPETEVISSLDDDEDEDEETDGGE